MNRKRVLGLSVVALLAVGMAAVATPFVRSMQPSARGDATLPRFDISDMAPGTYRHVSLEGAAYRGSWLLIKDWQGHITPFAMMRSPRGDGFMVQDVYVGRPGWLCHDFRPDGESGQLKPGGSIRCQDSGDPKWFVPDEPYVQWSYEGKNRQGGRFEDLYSPPSAVEGKWLVIGREEKSP